MRLKNRIVMPPMEQGLATLEGEVTEKLIEHYVRRAQNGVGLIIVEHTYITPQGRLSPRQLGIYHDNLIGGLSKLVKAVHAYGIPIAIQLNHAGARTTQLVCGERPVAPSAVALLGSKEIPRELTLQEIKALVEIYGLVASRSKKAGFDAVEIHGAHGFLLNQFASPLCNKRQDKYGGSLVNRMRFALQIIQKVRENIGPDFPLFYRLGADDRINGGLTLEEGKTMAKLLVEASINLIDVSGGLIGSRPKGMGPAFFVPLAEEIKQVVNVPVIGVGGIKTPELADEVIRQGRADLVAIGRAMLRDPAWAKKAIQVLESSKFTRP